MAGIILKSAVLLETVVGHSDRDILCVEVSKTCFGLHPPVYRATADSTKQGIVIERRMDQ
jgi:hypothetical protein